ncbi:unnamed protein product [Parascedosporium putredinis]|uniref:Integral membrane protein n=1 Tax=Parascedosporium putredinis TaxID=1442378 RepID=A0A9P1M745_9PEZI|nr:unnamed protein product [Parascedosporium putredinis]CAI7990898.1 unnamed protein product [Parascedosporium putredinis]
MSPSALASGRPSYISAKRRAAKSRRKQGADGEGDEGQGQGEERLLASLRRTLASGLGWNRFPAFCAALAGGSTLLEVPVRRLLQKLFGSALVGLALTNLYRDHPRAIRVPPGVEAKTIHHAGRTLDLTLFAVTRALDLVVRELWSSFSSSSSSSSTPSKRSKLDTFVRNIADPTVFSLSKWISSAAAVDDRLIEALRLCKQGRLRYGQDTGCADLLGSMCADFHLPIAWGDPAKTVPFPCELVHMGCGPSCERHALSRFFRSFAWSAATYLPLNLALQLRRPSARGLKRALLDALRSSAFLGSFIALFYYGVCLARTRVGPALLGTHLAARDAMDGGRCVAAGCFLCGWSILLEVPAAGPSSPSSKYAREDQWKETLAFATSAALLFTAAAEDKTKVRGVLGKLLAKVMQK